MNKAAAIIAIVAAIFVLGAGLLSWYHQYLNTEKTYKLSWDAGVRDVDVATVLLAAYDTTHDVENPNWHTAIKKAEQPAMFPEPVGTSAQVFYNITDLVQSIGDGTITFAVAYVDDSGNMSEWSTVAQVFDLTAPTKPVNFGIVK